VTACLLFSFAVRAIYDLETASFREHLFFLLWRELFVTNSETVRQCQKIDEELRNIWSQDESNSKGYLLKHRSLKQRRARLTQQLLRLGGPRLTQPESVEEVEGHLKELTLRCNDLHHVFADMRQLEEAEQRRVSSVEVVARKERFEVLVAQKRALLADEEIRWKLDLIWSVMTMISRQTFRLRVVEVALPIVCGIASIGVCVFKFVGPV
jgi:hypothetical protein